MKNFPPLRHCGLILLLAMALGFSACTGRRPQPTPAAPPAARPAEPAAAPASTPASGYETVRSAGDKLLLLGQTEYITLLPGHIRLPARIDTGATTSSLHALDIRKFERDGKKWVRFKLVRPDGRKVEMERPWVRTIEVKRHGTKQQVRPVVNLEVIIGPLRLRTQFSLTDRSQFKYPVLIGRSLLEGRAIVDVNREYVLSRIQGGKDAQ